MSENFFTILKLEIQSEHGKITFAKSSLFHGVLMEVINSQYAEKMHEMSMRPYSQCIVEQNGKVYWQITALNIEAYEEIIAPLESEMFREFTLKHCNWKVKVISRQIQKNFKKEWIRSFYQEDSSRMLKIIFHTPTSFKKSGEYAILVLCQDLVQIKMRSSAS